MIVVLASYVAIVLPAIGLAGLGYMLFIEHGLKLDTTAKPGGVVDRLLVLGAVLPILPVMILAIIVSSIPWMFVMSRLLSWADIEHLTKQRGLRVPFLSVWLDRLWLRMIKSRSPQIPMEGLSQ